MGGTPKAAPHALPHGARAAGAIASNRELEAQIAFYEREMVRARALQASEAAKLEVMLLQVDLAQATLSKAASDLAAVQHSSASAQQDLQKRR